MKIARLSFGFGLLTLSLAIFLLATLPNLNLPTQQEHLKFALGGMTIVGILMGGILMYVSITFDRPTSLNSQTTKDE